MTQDFVIASLLRLASELYMAGTYTTASPLVTWHTVAAYAAAAALALAALAPGPASIDAESVETVVIKKPIWFDLMTSIEVGTES